MVHPLIEEFLNYLRYERNFSNYTIRCYGTDLEQYCGYLESQSAAGEPGGTASTAPPPVPMTVATVAGTDGAAVATIDPAVEPAAPAPAPAPLDALGAAMLAITTADLR